MRIKEVKWMINHNYWHLHRLLIRILRRIKIKCLVMRKTEVRINKNSYLKHKNQICRKAIIGVMKSFKLLIKKLKPL
jgi:hypothetical protein